MSCDTLSQIGNVQFKTFSDICLHQNVAKMLISLVSMRWPLWHMLGHQLNQEGTSQNMLRSLATIGRRILAHAQTFGQNWSVKFGTSFDIFQCQNISESLIFLNFMRWHYGIPSDVGPIRKENFNTCLDLQTNCECPIWDIFWYLSLSKCDKNADLISFYGDSLCGTCSDIFSASFSTSQ